MAAINVLVVGDGPYLANNPPQDGINFAPSQDTTDDTFTVSEFLYLLTHGSAVSIAVDTAHRRNDPNATFQNFVFTTASIGKYDVLWLIGYEGWNYRDPPAGGAIGASEVAAITAFMDAGGGVFATGDHAGMGSFMGGSIPRVRTMRKWFARTQDLPAGYPSTATDYAGNSVTSLNWPGVSNNPNPGMGRADTLVMNPSDTTSQYQFDDQSDNIPQQLAFPNNIVHPILEGATGSLSRYPDHMHEGEVVTPSDLSATMTVNAQTYTEYPAVGGFQPAPSVVATGTIAGGHSTVVEGSQCEQNNFTTDTTLTTAGTIGILCAYDGRGSNVGRIVTDSSFHHYLDLNLVGDPCGSSPDRMAGFGTALSVPASGSVLADLQAFYVNTAIWLARPTKNFYFVVDKSTFGYDEASAGSTFPLFANTFWLVVDGYNLSQVQAAISAHALTLGGPFSGINGITITPGTPIATQALRVLIPYSVQFSGPAMSAFPGTNGNPVEKLLQAGIAVAGNEYTAETTFELVAGADPYFENVNPQQNNVFYLSQDLCVFTINPDSNPSVPGIPVTFSTSNPKGQDPGAASTFIEGVLKYMNGSTTFTDAGNSDPFSHFPSPVIATGDSSVTPSSNGITNYNFAIARVRLSGPTGTSANPVKVFFRLFLTQTNDTDYQPATSYLSTLDTSGFPDQPQSAPDGESVPFFASGSSAGDYGTGGVNVHSITVDATGETSMYFGCFLDVYSGTYNWKARGSHHCLVAQIAYDGAPIINANGITLGPNNSDKLAQRNLQITPSGNPGGPAAHRIPQTFDVRPSPPISTTGGTLLDYPDELIIDWGNTPVGSTATIYWPQVQALEVVRMARRLYGTDEFTLADPSTLQCTVKGGATCVPIPSGSGPRFAGLFTVDLPAGVKVGQEFNIVVRRFSTRRAGNDGTIGIIQNLPRTAATATATTTEAVARTNIQRNWRYVVGTFQVKIPVAGEDILLPAEENLYAIVLWRLNQLSPTDRWYPVLQRYLSYIAGRVTAFGGNPITILPSPTGVPQPVGIGEHHHRHEAEEFTGKVEGLLYDRFGDFEGFLLRTEHGHEHRFHATEHEIEERVHYAWTDRIVISVRVHKDHPSIPVSIILRRRPH
ncbi:hypothetical protein [Dyella psychrodurans]|uniref:Uncharacterized protein n=1 Tax=Dyella psychrodurans TaxID=1927960 RepID=A0A370X756_9GAMM|nr:hypothetical protein [Dyella psychrodurans]RDS84269.1 hypothetical protein DWU99_11040 [Dyella psychrodurans]